MEKAKTQLKLPLEFGRYSRKGGSFIELQFLPYQLNKDMPPEGMNKREQYAKKFGSQEQGEKAEEYMKMLGET